MRRRLPHRAASLLWAAMLTLLAPHGATGLSCVGFADPVSAAEEAVAGEHPLWARAYLIGRVDEVVRRDLELTLSISPTHVFSGKVGDRLRVAARSDGPPDPEAWRVGEHYFVALDRAGGIEGVDAIVAPCAPNFRIADADVIDRLVRAATAVEIRDTAPGSTGAGLPLASMALWGTALVGVAVGSVLAFRLRLRRSGS